MKKLAASILVLAIFLVSAPVHAQDTSLSLRMNRDFGYAGFGNDIEGLFSLIAEGPANLQRVEFYIDAALIATDDESPFRVQFTTKDHAPGEHRIYAIGYPASGAPLRSNEITRTFLSAEESRGKMVQLIGPLLGIMFGLILLITVVPAVLIRKRPERGKYGLSGGAICPHCALPFPLKFFSFNMGAKKFDRCPHCGKWVMVRRASPAALAEAEARWAAQDAPTGTAPRRSHEDEQIDNSRYEN